jgi:Ankyrin repeats (3 copies)
MSNLPPDDEDFPEVDALYRRLSAADPSQPGAGVRQAVLTHATQLAARAGETVNRPAYSWQRPLRAWGRPAAFGALAAGILAAFMLGPRIATPPPVPAPVDTVAQDQPGTPPVFADISSPSTQAAPSRAMAAPEGRVPRDVLKREPAMQPPAEMAAHKDLTARVSQPAPARAATSDSASSERAKVSGAAVAAAPAAVVSAPTSTNTTTAATARVPDDRGIVLWRAAEEGDLAALRELHARHANLDAVDAAGRTALMIATLHGHSQAVAALLDYGADPNIADGSGESPLDAALAADESEIITALKRHGAR